MNIQRTSRTLSIHINYKEFSLGCGCFALVGGLPFLTLGLSILCAFNHVITLNCQRAESTQITCVLNVSNFQGQRVKTVQLQGAEVKVDIDSQGEEVSQVLLLTTQGKVPLNEHYFMLDEHHQIAKQINYFVSHPEQRDLSIKQDDRLLGYVWGGSWTLFGAVGTFMGLLFIPFGITGEVWLFDKNLGRLQIIYQGRLINTQAKQKWLLNEIAQVQVIEEHDSDGKPRYGVSIESKSGDSVRLAISSSTREEYDQAAESIRDFLNLQAK